MGGRRGACSGQVAPKHGHKVLVVGNYNELQVAGRRVLVNDAASEKCRCGWGVNARLRECENDTCLLAQRLREPFLVVFVKVGGGLIQCQHATAGAEAFR